MIVRLGFQFLGAFCFQEQTPFFSARWRGHRHIVSLVAPALYIYPTYPLKCRDHDLDPALAALDTSVSPRPENPGNPGNNMVATPNDSDGRRARSQRALIEDEASSDVSLCVENIDGPTTEEALPRPSSPSASNSEISF